MTTLTGALLIVLAVATLIVQSRFFRALARRDPRAFISDDVVMQQFEHPSRFVSIMANATRSRLRVLVHAAPYPEVECLRRWLLALLVATAVSFATWVWFD